MEKVTLDFVCEAVGGKLYGDGAATVKDVSTDTRSVVRDSLFIALQGEKFNGNDFLDTAFERGAAACLAEKPCGAGPTVVVGDTSAALLALAKAYRELFNIPVVGVTGSVGKTSTKDMIACVLSQKYVTLKNEGNRNNEIGMPLTVLGLERKHGAAVFEMGMSGFGEISRMTSVARPRIAVMTNIGISHIEKLGTRGNILRAKLEILEGLENGGSLVLNGDDKLLKDAGKEVPSRYLYGIDNKSCDVRAENIENGADGTRFTLVYPAGRIQVHLGVAGKHNVYNALAAFCCGLLLGVEPEKASEGLAGFAPTGMRQKIEKVGGVTLIEDCYNASPDSMASAFELLGSMKTTGRRIAVLADMLELGQQARRAHLGVGRAAYEAGTDVLLAYGENAAYYCEGFDGARKGESGGRICIHFESKKELADGLLGLMREEDVVLFKGSRGMKLEDTIKTVCERWKNK